MTLTAIAGEIGETHAGTVKHHLGQLVKKGSLTDNWQPADQGGQGMISIPFYGFANCGPTTLFSDEHLEGYLKVSEKLLPRKTGSLLALKAAGHSLNRSDIDGDNIESGDYVIIDGDVQNPADKDYVLAIVDGSAVMKKYRLDGDKVFLISESTEDFPPIALHREDDISDFIGGKIIKVIKNPN